MRKVLNIFKNRLHSKTSNYSQFHKSITLPAQHFYAPKNLFFISIKRLSKFPISENISSLIHRTLLWLVSSLASFSEILTNISFLNNCFYLVIAWFGPKNSLEFKEQSHHLIVTTILEKITGVQFNARNIN